MQMRSRKHCKLLICSVILGRPKIFDALNFICFFYWKLAILQYPLIRYCFQRRKFYKSGLFYEVMTKP